MASRCSNGCYCSWCFGAFGAAPAPLRTKTRDDFASYPAGAGDVAGRQRNCRDPGMAAAAKLLGERGEIFLGGSVVPGIRTERDLGANRGGADSYRIKRLGKQEIRYELIAALQI